MEKLVMKNICCLLAGIICLLLIDPAVAQLKLPQLSSSQTLIQEFGLGSVTVKYSRPNMKGRRVFSDLAPYGEVWRTGANTATLITFTDEVTLEGRTVKAGDYALFTIPGKDSWTIILNSDTKQWGSYQYKESNDVLRFQVKPSKLYEATETFTISFSDVLPTSAKLNLIWDVTKVSIAMATDVDNKVMAGIAEAMKGDKKPYLESAIYYYENGKDLTQALQWAIAAEALDPKAPWFKYWKARIQLKAGDKAGAAETARAGIVAAKAMNMTEYIRLNSAVLAQSTKN